MIRVLLIDDHAIFLSSLRLRLEQEDDITPVGEAGSAEQGIARARVLKPDVILIDLLLPRKSGYEAIPEISSATPQSRIIVLSSQTGPTPVRQAISAGAHGYVPKRASDTELIEAIRRVAAGERYVDPDLGAQLVVADDVPALEPLTNRERDILHLLALGHTTRRSATSSSSRCEPSTRTAHTSCASCSSHARRARALLARERTDRRYVTSLPAW